MKAWSKFFCILPSALLVGATGCMHLDSKQAQSTDPYRSTDRFKSQLATAPVQVAGRNLRTVDGAVASGDRFDNVKETRRALAAHASIEDANADASGAAADDHDVTQTPGRRSLPFFPVFAVRPW